MKQSQKQLILEYVRQHGKITPAKMTGVVFMGQMFGSEVSRRCRDLRKEGKLLSHAVGKFEEYSTVIIDYHFNVKTAHISMNNASLFQTDQATYGQI